MPIFCIALCAVLAGVLCWAVLLKLDIRQLGKKLAEINRIGTNACVTTGTFDKDIATLAYNINQLLDCGRRDLLDKVRAESDLKRAITNISHDLRTPLTGALGYLQMLETSELDDAERARYFETIRGRLEVLSNLMNSLFEFTRVAEGRLKLELQEVNICNIVRDALSLSYAELDSKGFAVDADIPDSPVFCVCDADALARMLQNLLKNVCVHGHDYLRVRVEGGVIEVSNRAEGLKELDTARIFDRFYTADAPRTSKSTGLGLAIVKELAARQGGQITAELDNDLIIIRLSLRK